MKTILRLSIMLILVAVQALVPSAAQARTLLTPAAPALPPALYSAFLDTSAKNTPAVQTPGLTTSFSAAGLSVAPQSGAAWKWNIKLDRFGRPGKASPLSAPKVSQSGGRTQYSYAAFTEWYRSTGVGLEQGFTIPQKPSGSGKLVLHMLLDTGLSGALSSDNRSLSFSTGDGQALHYSNLRAVDAKGQELSASLVYSAGQIAIQVDDQSAAYPITVDPLIFVENQLYTLDGAKHDQFGYSVSISGDTAVVGAPNHQIGSNNGQGAVYIFQSQGGNWVQQAGLTASDGAANDRFGSAVAISGNTVIVGAPFHNAVRGEAYIFVKPVSGWVDSTENARLNTSNGAANDFFGYSVAISGVVAIVGAYNHASAHGQACVFVKPIRGWASATETGFLSPSNGAEYDTFGWSVAISGDTAIIAAPGHNANLGAAYLFQKPIGGWTTKSQDAILTASDSASNDLFGTSVGISGNTVVIGADGYNSYQGKAYVFVRPALGWADSHQTAILTASDGAASDYFGYSVAVSGDTVLIGAYRHAGSQGEAYLFVKPAGGWVTATQSSILTASDGSSPDSFGISVAISGATAFIGAQQHASKGAAYAYFPYHAEDLGINASSNTLIPLVGQIVTFTVTVTNFASNPSPDVMVSAPLPAGFNLLNAASALGSYDPLTGNWTIASLGADVIAALTLQSIVTDAAAGTTPVFTAALLGWDSNPFNNTVSVTLNPVPVMNSFPTSLIFSGQLTQTTSPAQTVTLYNVTMGSLTLGTLAAPTGFVLSANNCSGHKLGFGGLCTFALQFKPTSAIYYSTNLTIPVTSPAASYSLPVSGTGLAGTQLLTNTSFETDANHDHVPDGWKKAGTWVAGTDGQDCTVHHTGKCALKFTGTKVIKSITFTITKGGGSGDDFLLSVWRHATSIPSGSTVDATVKVYSGSTLKATKKVTLPAGTYVFTQSSLPFTMTTSYTKLVVTLEYKGASGTLWLDDASLVWAP